MDSSAKETKEPATSDCAPAELSADASTQQQQLPQEGGATSLTSAADVVDKDDHENDESTRSQVATAILDGSSVNETDNAAPSAASDDGDVSDVCSSIAESENADQAAHVVVGTTSSKSASKPRKRVRQPAIMIGYKKRRKAQSAVVKKNEDDVGMTSTEMETSSASGVEAHSDSEDKYEPSTKLLEQSSFEENLLENSAASARRTRKYSSVSSEVTGADKFCWICHKEGGTMLKCVACPRVYHSKCHFQGGLPEGSGYDPSTFHCPECSAVLKADNLNTRSPVLVTVNLEQLCTLLQHIVAIMKSQKDSHYFWGPVDTKEFPHYREYVIYPMDLSVLEKNIKNEVYGCTEAFLADVKWIVHNSIVFNTSAAKITNVAKNLLKICKREILEVETCAECYYNSLVRKDTWFIEVCKKPHLLVWARLKGYPPWPAKALKCKDGMVDCRFFGAHDKAWVPLKDCFLYSKIAPQPVKLKKGSHLESGIQELEKHIKKLKDKFGIFVYPASRIPYRPSQELEQLRIMLPNYNPNSSLRSTKYLIHPDRIRNNLQPKTLFGDGDEKPVPDRDEMLADEEEKPSDEVDSEANLTAEMEKTSDSPPHNDIVMDDSSFDSSSEAEMSAVPADVTTSPSSSTTKVETPLSSPTQTTWCEQSPASSSRKLVSVKNIDSINASVTSTPVVSPVSTPPPEAMSGSTTFPDESKDKSPTATAAATATQAAEVVKNTTWAAVTPKSPSTLALASVTPPKTQVQTPFSESTQSGVDFDLSKVKDEPVEGQEVTVKDVDATVKDVDTTVKEVNAAVVKASEAVATTNQESSLSSALRLASVPPKPKRPSESEETKPVKRVKPDPKCRTVNITENVTLSLINQSPPVDPPPKTRPINTVVKQKKPVSLPVPPMIPVTAAGVAAVISSASSSTALPATRLVYGFTSPSDINVLRTKVSTTPTLLPVTSTVVPMSRPNTKIQPRIVNPVSQTNGALNISTKPAVTVTPSRSSPKFNESYSDFFNKVMNECLTECHSQFRRIFESTLDKLINKGDLRARIVALKKEMDVIKRNHELVIDEMRRDYEVQIAELRATSVAKSQFDLAAERVKLEQEKERAVKEAKSKQWCSNCQKIANYYCCWNTAYCDFECQKEHWMQHMHVCKNDVKKKAAESSENEPPRIMMQSEISNGYAMNGYDRTGSTFSYGNVGAPLVSSPHSRNGNFNRPRNKISCVVRPPRPLLPRVTCTVASSTPSNSPSVNGGIAQNTYQNSRPSAYSIGNNTATVYSPLYQK